MTVAMALVLSPPGREIFYAAFISSERFLQDLMQMIYLAGVAIAILLAVIEWRVRIVIIRRRALALASVPATGDSKTES